MGSIKSQECVVHGVLEDILLCIPLVVNDAGWISRSLYRKIGPCPWRAIHSMILQCRGLPGNGTDGGWILLVLDREFLIVQHFSAYRSGIGKLLLVAN